MVWMVIGIPLTSVIVGIALVVLAVYSHDGLVVDDYYKEGLEINRTLERDARARELGLQASVELDKGANRVSVVLTGTPAFDAPPEIKLGFYHATREDQDRVLTLRRDGEGVYSAPMPVLPGGRWYVSAETPAWRLMRPVLLPEDEGFTMTAKSPQASTGVPRG